MCAKRHAQPSVRLCALLAGHVVRVRSFDVSVERSSPRGYAFFIPLGSGERPSASPLLSQDDNSIPKTAADGRGGIQTHPFAPFLLRTLRLRRMNRRFRRICRGPGRDSTVPWFDRQLQVELQGFGFGEMTISVRPFLSFRFARWLASCARQPYQRSNRLSSSPGGAQTRQTEINVANYTTFSVPRSSQSMS